MGHRRGSIVARPPRIRAGRRGAIIGGFPLAVLATVVIMVATTGGRITHRSHLSATKPVIYASALTPHHRLSALEARGDRIIRRLAALGLPVYCAGPHGHELAFTFDDGPGVYTHYAVKKLAQAHEGATFFVVGKSIVAWPGWLQRELRVGTLGDHTLTHPDLLELPPAQVAAQLESDKLLIERESGQPVYVFRPPYGAQDAAVNRIARRLGLLDIMWSIDSRDSLGANWAGIIRNVESHLRPGAIILMHENRGQTIRALTALLPVLHKRHFSSVSVPELFATDPPSPAQVRRGLSGCTGHPRASSNLAGAV